MKGIRFLFIYMCLFCVSIEADVLFLRDNFQEALPGDYVVALASKTFTVMHIYGKNGNRLTIEEVVVPSSRCSPEINWKEWIANGGPNHTSWVIYEIDTQSGKVSHYYSFTKRNWFEIPDSDHFLSKLLNLTFTRVPDHVRKKVGRVSNTENDPRNFWQPKMTVNGQIIPGFPFDAWQTKWPNDGSELSGKNIEMYLPQDRKAFPSYFPYWLQIRGTIGRATIRIVDSGRNMQSPKQNPIYKQFSTDIY
jgi:hypothetical protein